MYRDLPLVQILFNHDLDHADSPIDFGDVQGQDLGVILVDNLIHGI